MGFVLCYLAVAILPDKPNYTTPADQPSAHELELAQQTLSKLSCVQHVEQTPNQVYALPITGNMEYGFFQQQMVGLWLWLQV